MDLSGIQELMAEIYLERDERRGAEKTLIWMLSEAGEVADAFLKDNREALRSEVADLLAWLLSFCNVVGIDLEDAVLAKYGGGCPNCGSKPCRCPPK
ncbi:MAG: nucleotide pyrophosphohydrolase [Thaumarchaeota archaeon]|nr:nucleotide pyrophosphohydrolase [Nitrososphaerota archaeon]